MGVRPIWHKFKNIEKVMKKINDVAKRIYLRGVPVLGCHGIEVGVDESKFGKRNIQSERVWVLGIVEC